MLLDVKFQGNGIAIFHATGGELHANSLERLEELCDVMQRQGKIGIILELSGLRRVSAGGLAALVELVSLRRDQEIGICSPPEKLLRLIEQLGLYRGLPIYKDLPNALRSSQFKRCHLRGLRCVVFCSSQSRGILDQAGPSEMLDVLGKPLIHRVLDGLADYGCSITYLKPGRNARRLASYLSGEQVIGQSQFLLGAEMGAASEELGSLLRHLVDSQISGQDDLLILPGDQLNTADLGAFVEHHKDSRADLSVMVTEEGTNGAPSDQDMDLWEPSGIMIRPELIPHLPTDGCQSLSELACFLRRKKRKVAVYRAGARLLHVNSVTSYQHVLTSLMTSPIDGVLPFGTAAEAGIWHGAGSRVSARAKITGPVFIGDGAEVPRNVRLIGPVVIGAGVKIPSRTLVRNSIILSDQTLETGALVDGKLVLNDRQLSLSAPAAPRHLLTIPHEIPELDVLQEPQEKLA
ncbi:STAS domain-containing protein [Actibacterium pelagium]|uniref:STAS domain-containing protein n=1 Tax=Actibacterium pelagium TaxID=2029103 RepID=A0A917AHH3_9RHOB|nr:STAS domain-containing protein [Actibacterium pelagium]GGE54167.1 hypothetical protein GCM10011517_22200 [Actibacterium pelagium]